MASAQYLLAALVRVCSVIALLACARAAAARRRRTCRRSRASRTSRFSRDAVVAIALREWRLFGSPVDDDPPGSYRPATPEDKPERQQGPVAARRRVLVAGDECRRAGSRPGPASTTRTASCFRRARTAPTPGRPPSSPTSCASPVPARAFRIPPAIPTTSTSPKQMAAGPDVGLAGHRRASRGLCAAAGRSDLPRPRQRARSALRRSAGRAFSRAIATSWWIRRCRVRSAWSAAMSMMR